MTNDRPDDRPPSLTDRAHALNVLAVQDPPQYGDVAGQRYEDDMLRALVHPSWIVDGLYVAGFDDLRKALNIWEQVDPDHIITTDRPAWLDESVLGAVWRLLHTYGSEPCAQCLSLRLPAEDVRAATDESDLCGPHRVAQVLAVRRAWQIVTPVETAGVTVGGAA